MAFTDYQRSALRHPSRWLRNPQPENPDGEDIPRRELSSLTVALTGQGHIFNMVGSDRLMHFAVNVLRIPPVTFGSVMAGTVFFDAFNDLAAGAIVDNHRFKDGRKLLPWMKFTVPLIGLFSFLLFTNLGLPPGLSMIYTLVMFLLWDVFYSLHDAAMWGMTAAIHPSSRQCARTVQWADMGVFFGGLLPGLTDVFLGGGGVMGMNQQQWYSVFAVVLCLGGGFMLLLALRMKERVRSQPAAKIPGESRAKQTAAALLKNIARVRVNHVLLLFFAVRMFESLTPNVSNIFMFQDMADYNVLGLFNIHPTLMITIFTIVFGFPGAALKPFALKIADRVGNMKTILIIGRVTAVITRTLGFFVGVSTWQRMMLVCLLDGISELPNSLFNIAQRSMLSDSVDYVEWKTGHRTEAMTMSIRNLMGKSGAAMRRFLMGFTLRFLQHSPDATAASQPQNAHFQRWVWPAFRLGPAMGLVLSLIPLLLINYPNSLRDQVEGDLAARRADEQALRDDAFDAQ